MLCRINCFVFHIGLFVVLGSTIAQSQEKTPQATDAPKSEGTAATTTTDSQSPMPAAADPEAAKKAAEQQKKQEHLQKIQQLQFDRRPSTILKMWSSPPGTTLEELQRLQGMAIRVPLAVRGGAMRSGQNGFQRGSRGGVGGTLGGAGAQAQGQHGDRRSDAETRESAHPRSFGHAPGRGVAKIVQSPRSRLPAASSTTTTYRRARRHRRITSPGACRPRASRARHRRRARIDDYQRPF